MPLDNSTISTLLGVILGAISSSVPKIWDYFFEGKKHKQSLSKVYFERKLNVLQAYVATCTQLSASNFNNAIAVEQMKHLSFFGEQDPMRLTVIANLETQVSKSQDQIKQWADLSNAASMFMDLKIDQQMAYDLIKSIHVDIARLGEIKNEVDSVIAIYNFEKEPPSKDPGGNEFFLKKEAYMNHLQRIADNYNKIKTNLNDCIKQVRAEFSKY